MDSLTHLVFGAVAGEVIAGKKLGKKAMLFGALAANLPDFDSIMNFIVSDAESMLIHRGLSHSLLVAFLAGPLIGYLLWKLPWKQKSTPSVWIALITLNLFFHDMIDCCNMYGTGLLLPFSEHRFSLDNIFVADPVFTIPLLLSAIALLIIGINKSNRKKWVVFGFTLSSFYLLTTFYHHSKAVNALQSSISRKGIETTGTFAVPTLFNSVLWYTVARSDEGYWAGYYSIFDSADPELYFIETQNELEQLVNQPQTIKWLKQFSQGYYCYRQKDSTIYFNDLRFGQVNGWDDPESNFAYAFDLTPGADNKMVVQQGRVEGTKSEVMKSMWNRMKGK